MTIPQAATVRPYRPEDRAAVFRIAADTAFFGEPIEAYFEDRHLFCDAFYSYYTDLEPENGWVACAEGRVIGFIVGSTDTKAYQRRLMRHILPPVVLRFLRGAYHPGPQAWRYLRALAAAAVHREFPHADLDRYPAHLHINLEAGWRGYGLGRRLMEAFIQRLKSMNVSGVHLHTTSMNRAACGLYRSCGFDLLDSRVTRIWAHLIREPVENRCYGLTLTCER